MHLLLWIPVSKTTSLPLSHTYMFAISQSSKCFIMPSTLQALKLNFLPLDVVLTKLPIYMVFPKSLLSWIQFMQQKISLILHLTHSKSMWLSSSMTLESFFTHHQENMIKFWECPSKSKWNLYKRVNIETKLFNLTPLLPNKNSWDFSKRSECNNIIDKWKMTFQVSDLKDRNFLELVNSDNNILEPIYSKGST